MVDLFKERYLELPAFQKIRQILDEGLDGEVSLNELTTRVMMALEDGLNWDTMCQNCGVLMDDNYAQHVEIEKLKEQIERPLFVICGTCLRRKEVPHYCNPDF